MDGGTYAPMLCTCGPWHGVIPPPPCPVHPTGIRYTPPVPPEWTTTTTTTTAPVFTEDMLRRAMGQQSCDVSEVPFCGWTDALPKGGE